MKHRMTVLVLLAAFLAPALCAAEEDPDFEDFMALIETTLVGSGSGVHVGDRSEIYRYSPDGWEIQMMTVWDGHGWHLLALRLHHSERIEELEGEWQERYDHLLARINRDRIAELNVPELIDIPPPSYSPALPEELRSRRFVYDGFWYEARWINVGGVDDRARWALRSYELVAMP